WIFILADTAFAYAMTTAAPGALTAGAEIRFRRPAYAGQRLRAVARVERISGRDILAHADVFTTAPEPIAVFTGTGRVPRSATGATS
ncbi:MAG: hypothetical protein J0H91_19035, partial [Rhodospirillales bacterium]|nr:hypothetical protein [Rhodospirillales bacterium]